MTRTTGNDGRSSDCRGVGLAEALVALTVLALAGTVAFVLFNGARESFKAGDNLIEQQQVVRIALDLLTSDLRLAGFNSNPDGDRERPDEQIEAAFDTAIVFRADFDAADPTLSTQPEQDLADSTSGAKFNTVSIGNDEIVAYALGNAGSGDTLTFEADVTPSVRDGVVEPVDLDNVAIAQSDPPYTLYRISLAPDGTAVLTPVIDNVRSLRFVYYDVAGNVMTAPGGLDDAAGDGRKARASIRRIGVEIEGLTRDSHVRWSDPNDPVPGPDGRGEYRKYTLSSDSTPPNLGMFGIRDLDAVSSPPSTPPPPTLHPGHCGGLWVTWAPNPPQDEVARYELRYGTSMASLTGPRYATVNTHYIDGLNDGTRYYVTVEAVDDSGSISQPSPESDMPAENLNRPESPANATATEGATARANENVIGWDAVLENEPSSAAPLADPLSPRMRDFQGYRVYRAPNAPFDPSPSNLLSEPGTTQYDDKDVVNCRPYRYRVTAVDLCGLEGEPTDAISGRSVATHPPAPPINAQAFWVGAVGASRIRVEWDPVVRNENGDQIYIEDYWVQKAQGPPGANEASLVFNTAYRDIHRQTWFEESLGTFGGPQVNYYRVVAVDDCPSNQSPTSEYTWPECTFYGDATIVDPPDNFAIPAGTASLALRADVVNPNSIYNVHFSVVDADTGQLVYGPWTYATQPPWTHDWDLTGVPDGPYRIDVAVEQTDGCRETTSHFVRQLPP